MNQTPVCLTGILPEIQAEHDRLGQKLQNNIQYQRCFDKYGFPAAGALEEIKTLRILEDKGAFIRGYHCPVMMGTM